MADIVTTDLWPEIQVKCLCTSHCNRMAVNDILFYQWRVNKFLVKENNSGADIADYVSVYEDVRTDASRMWHCNNFWMAKSSSSCLVAVKQKQPAQNAISTALIKDNQQVGEIVAQLETGYNAVKNIIATLGYKTFTATAPGSFNKQILIYYLLRINKALLVDTLLLKSNCSGTNLSGLE